MYYVYLLRSLGHPNKTYIGFSHNVFKRLTYHNAGQSPYTSQFKPWKIETYIAFSDEKLARKFEKYLKIGSGYAFAHKRLWSKTL